MCLVGNEESGEYEARTRLDLEARLERGVGKWKKRGYSIEIVKVACIEEVQSAVLE